jgi:signal transduction histidine kinase
VTIYVVATTVLSIQHTLTQAPQLSQARLTAELTQTPLAGIACVLALWMPTAGAVVGLAMLLMTLLQQPTGTDFFFVLLITPIMFTATQPLRRVLGLAALHLAYAFAQAGRAAEQAVIVMAQYTAWLTIAYGIGGVVRWLMQARGRGVSRINALAKANESIAAVERSLLAHELGVIVSAALAGLRDAVREAHRPPAARGDGPDPWDEFDRLARDTLSELRRLVGVLREDGPATSPGSTDPTAQRAPILLRHTFTVALGVLTFVQFGRISNYLPELPIAIMALTAAVALMWWPRWGLLITAATLISALASGSQTASVLGLLVIMPIALAVASPRPVLRIGVGLGVGYVVMLATGGEKAVTATVFASGMLVAGLVTGMAAAFYLDSRRRALSRLEELERECEAGRIAERRRLARDLHDVIAHQLSLVCLQVMAHGGGEDLVERESALGIIEQATSSAQRDLALLISVMDEDSVAHGSKAVATDHLTPTAVATDLASTLRSHGHPTTVDVPGAADHCSPMTRQTLSRTMQESATNALRYAPPGSPCALEVCLGPDSITLRFTSRLGGRPRTSSLSSGFGLRGIRERVALTGGTFAAGPHHGLWVLRVTLPLA